MNEPLGLNTVCPLSATFFFYVMGNSQKFVNNCLKMVKIGIFTCFLRELRIIIVWRKSEG